MEHSKWFAAARVVAWMAAFSLAGIAGATGRVDCPYCGGTGVADSDLAYDPGAHYCFGPPGCEPCGRAGTLGAGWFGWHVTTLPFRALQLAVLRVVDGGSAAVATERPVRVGMMTSGRDQVEDVDRLHAPGLAASMKAMSDATRDSAVLVENGGIISSRMADGTRSRSAPSKRAIARPQSEGRPRTSVSSRTSTSSRPVGSLVKRSRYRSGNRLTVSATS